MNLMARRRALMGASNGGLPPVPSGYITNGLVFFLDGKQLATATKWTDIVGGKVFNLVNCSAGTNGIVFDGTGYGWRDGTITDDWQNETIEIVADLPKFTSASDVTTIFNQPVISGAMGIGLRFGYNGRIRACIAQDGVKRTLFEWQEDGGRNRIGINTARMIVNATNQTNTSSSSYGANTTTRTFLGARATTDSDTTYTRFVGTIYAVRIYNRILSDAEIIANQTVDASYYPA